MAAVGLGESNTGKVSLLETLSQPKTRHWGYTGHTQRLQCESSRRSFLYVLCHHGG